MGNPINNFTTSLVFISSLLPAIAMDAPPLPAATNNLCMPKSHYSPSADSLFSLIQDKLLTSAMQKCIEAFPDLYSQCSDSYPSHLKELFLERGVENLENIEDLFQAIRDNYLLSTDEATLSADLDSDRIIISFLFKDPSFSTQSIKLLGDLFHIYNLNSYKRFVTVKVLQEAKLTSAESIKETLKFLADVSQLKWLTVREMWASGVIKKSAESPGYKMLLLKTAKSWWLRPLSNLIAQGMIGKIN